MRTTNFLIQTIPLFGQWSEETEEGEMDYCKNKLLIEKMVPFPVGVAEVYDLLRQMVQIQKKGTFLEIKCVILQVIAAYLSEYKAVLK